MLSTMPMYALTYILYYIIYYITEYVIILILIIVTDIYYVPYRIGACALWNMLSSNRSMSLVLIELATSKIHTVSM